MLASAIVALGVFFEYLFSQAGSSAHGELIRRSNDRLAKTTRTASKANARAEKALKRVAKMMGQLADANRESARLGKEAAEAHERAAELERITSPRRLTSEQRQGIIDVIRPIAADLKLLVQCQSSDAEAYGYARSIATAFLRAGVPREYIELTAVSLLNGLTFGVHAQSDTLDLNKLQELDPFIASPFMVTARNLTMQVTRSQFRPTLYIFVGPRVTPGTFDDNADDGDSTVWA